MTRLFALSSVLIIAFGSASVALSAPVLEQTPRSCWRFVQNVTARESLVKADIAEVDCPTSASDLRLHYRSEDRSYYADTDLDAGGVFSLSFRPVLPDIRRGEAITISTTIGLVRVIRSAIALQPGRVGKSVFVRTQNGQILTAEVPGVRP